MKVQLPVIARKVDFKEVTDIIVTIESAGLVVQEYLTARPHAIILYKTLKILHMTSNIVDIEVRQEVSKPYASPSVNISAEIKRRLDDKIATMVTEETKDVPKRIPTSLVSSPTPTESPVRLSSPDWTGFDEYENASWFPYLKQGTKIRNEIDFITALIRLVKTVSEESVFKDIILCLMDMYRDDTLESMHIDMLNSIVSL